MSKKSVVFQKWAEHSDNDQDDLIPLKESDQKIINLRNSEYRISEIAQLLKKSMSYIRSRLTILRNKGLDNNQTEEIPMATLPVDPAARQGVILRAYCRKCRKCKQQNRAIIAVTDKVWWGPYCPFSPARQRIPWKG